MKFCVVFVSLLLISQTFAQCPDWSYSGSNGPEFWGSLCSEYATCDTGNRQSPINIQRSNAVRRNVNVDVRQSSEQDLVFLNNGHTVEVEYSHAAGQNFITVDDNDIFDLLQFHVHTPSENTVDGKQYDMEVHFVHANTFSELSVLGVFIDAPDDDSECSFLDQFMNDLPEDDGDENEVDINRFVEFDDDTDYYTFAGSLTTPPCTEGVNWIVRAEPIRCARSQVEEFKNIIGTSSRPVQSKNSREVVLGDSGEQSASSNSNTNTRSNSDSSSGASNVSSAGGVLSLLFASLIVLAF